MEGSHFTVVVVARLTIHVSESMLQTLQTLIMSVSRNVGHVEIKWAVWIVAGVDDGRTWRYRTAAGGSRCCG